MAAPSSRCGLQENFLFNTSVRENIAVHKPTATMDHIVRVAKAAGAHEFILELPEGYDTVAGENGEGLSGVRSSASLSRVLCCTIQRFLFSTKPPRRLIMSQRILYRKTCAPDYGWAHGDYHCTSSLNPKKCR